MRNFCSRAALALAIATGCGSSERRSEPPPAPARAPWRLVQRNAEYSKIECTRPAPLPTCQGKAQNVIRKLDSTLLDQVGKRVTLAGKIEEVGGMCSTNLDCGKGCCNTCGSLLGLGNHPGNSEQSIDVIVGRCSGDECVECCDLPIAGQRVRVSGVLVGANMYGEELDLSEALQETGPGPRRLQEVFTRADEDYYSRVEYYFALQDQQVCIER